LVNRIHQDRQRPCFRPPFHAVNFVHGRQIERVRRQSIKRVCGIAITLPRERKSAAYRSTSASGLIGLTRSSSAGNFLAFGEDVPPVFGRRYHTTRNWCNITSSLKGKKQRAASIYSTRSFSFANASCPQRLSSDLYSLASYLWLVQSVAHAIRVTPQP